MTVYVFILVAFLEGVPVHKEAGATKTLLECEALKIYNQEVAKQRGHTLWQSDCILVPMPEEKKPALPPPKPTDGDGISLDGQRRGGKS